MLSCTSCTKLTRVSHSYPIVTTNKKNGIFNSNFFWGYIRNLAINQNRVFRVSRSFSLLPQKKCHFPLLFRNTHTLVDRREDKFYSDTKMEVENNINLLKECVENLTDNYSEKPSTILFRNLRLLGESINMLEDSLFRYKMLSGINNSQNIFKTLKVIYSELDPVKTRISKHLEIIKSKLLKDSSKLNLQLVNSLEEKIKNL